MGMTTLGSVAMGLVWGWLVAMTRTRAPSRWAALLAATTAVAALIALTTSARNAVLAGAAIAVSAALHLSWRHWLARRYPTRELT